MFLLSNPVKHYDWGHPVWIPDFLGKAMPNGQPVAELWMGTLPGGPSQIETPEGLKDLRTVCPQGLSFLFKLLAARRALSIQAHPDLKQASAGFASENERGIALDDPKRNYKDPNHKPEFLVALDAPFWGLAGFQNPAAIQATLDETSKRATRRVPLLEDLRSALAEGGLRALTLTLLETDREAWRAAEPIISEAVARSSSPATPWFSKLLGDFPGDPSVLFTLILNLFRLEPGQGLFIPAGCLHAYLEGFGLELMAASDNILRGGLTPKTIDREELGRIVVFEPSPLKILEPRATSSGEEAFEPSVPDFRLGRFEGQDREFSLTPPTTAWILVVTEGRAQVSQGSQTLELQKGQSAILLPGRDPVHVRTAGTLYRAWSQ